MSWRATDAGLGGAAEKEWREEFYRLFMVPGMMHCQGGEGATDQFDKIAALEQWVERGIAPDKLSPPT